VMTEKKGKKNPHCPHFSQELNSKTAPEYMRVICNVFHYVVKPSWQTRWENWDNIKSRQRD
jgi:hypothetical protein